MNNLPCLICKKPLPPEGGEDQKQIQPGDGIVCTSRGNYGSKVYDSIIDSNGNDCELVFNICDDCLINAADDGLIGEYVGLSPEAIPYTVDPQTKIWVESEGFDDYHRKLEEYFPALDISE